MQKSYRQTHLVLETVDRAIDVCCLFLWTMENADVMPMQTPAVKSATIELVFMTCGIFLSVSRKVH